MENIVENHLEIYSETKNFFEFYTENKEKIFLKIIDTFESLQNADVSKLTVSSKLKNGLHWVTEFVYTKDDKNLLIDDIMPFFIEIEKYEICEKIKQINKII